MKGHIVPQAMRTRDVVRAKGLELGGGQAHSVVRKPTRLL